MSLGGLVSPLGLFYAAVWMVDKGKAVANELRYAVLNYKYYRRELGFPIVIEKLSNMFDNFSDSPWKPNTRLCHAWHKHDPEHTPGRCDRF